MMLDFGMDRLQVLRDHALLWFRDGTFALLDHWYVENHQHGDYVGMHKPNYAGDVK
jgi:hypothetical protein